MPRRGLSPADLSAVDDLERRVVAVDGGRLKLEKDTLRRRTGEQVDDLLWVEADRLVGFLGLYRFGGGALELAGAVDPDARRRGIGGALVDAALGLAAERGLAQALLVAPRSSAGARPLAVARGGVLDHSEHALALTQEPEDGPARAGLELRRARPADAPAVGRLLEEAFGHPVRTVADALGDDDEQTLVVELDGALVGTLRRALSGDEGGVYGFAVDPAVQGRGIGRDVLRRVCRQLRADGARRVGLEVSVDNDRALGLYTSVGFGLVTTEDYWALPVPAA